MLQHKQTPICVGLIVKIKGRRPKILDKITKGIIFDLLKEGNPIEMVSFEMGISSQDIKAAMREADRNKISNMLAEQLASRLPSLLELSFKQLQNIILTGDTNQRLRAINTIFKTSTALAKIKPL
jgi:hypothetical protein